jgi:predicted aspartyl protease
MIYGMVNARREAVVRLRVRGPGGTELDLEAVIDTGFSASLTLPSVTVAALGLAQLSDGRAVLADGSIRQFEIYAAEVA